MIHALFMSCRRPEPFMQYMSRKENPGPGWEVKNKNQQQQVMGELMGKSVSKIRAPNDKGKDAADHYRKPLTADHVIGKLPIPHATCAGGHMTRQRGTSHARNANTAHRAHRTTERALHDSGAQGAA